MGTTLKMFLGIEIKNDCNKSCAKLSKIEKLKKNFFYIFSDFGQKMASKFPLRLAIDVPAEPAHFYSCPWFVNSNMVALYEN